MMMMYVNHTLTFTHSDATPREVTGSNPVEVLTFTGFYAQLLKLRS